MRIGKNKAAEVLAFPSLTAIPAPELPLRDFAYTKYSELANRLLTAKKLNKYTQKLCENIAILEARNYERMDMGLLPSQASILNIDKLYKELRLVDQSDATAPEEEGSENRFSRYGVIIRSGTQKAEV